MMFANKKLGSFSFNQQQQQQQRLPAGLEQTSSAAAATMALEEAAPGPSAADAAAVATGGATGVGGGLQQQQQADGGSGDGEAAVDKTKLIVNYIPQYTTEEDLALVFTQVGPIESIRIMKNLRTGYSYGYGFVKYVRAEDAAKAIEALSGMNYRNKRLKVSYSRPPGQTMKESNLYISNLPKDVTERDLDRMFGVYGEIIQRNVLKDKITGLPRGVAFVRFSKREEAQAAIANLDGKQLEKSMYPLSVRVADDHSKQKAQFLEHQSYFLSRSFGGVRGPFPRATTFPQRNPNYVNSRFLGAGDSHFLSSMFW